MTRGLSQVRIDRAWTGVALVLAAATAAAQDSAVKSAADAFGERVGTEQSGLYSETQVRGFDLNDSGAYRIDDAYFIRAAALNDPLLAGVGVRVGVNAVRLAYPAPSGVVNYRLRQAGPDQRVAARCGLARFRHARGTGRWFVSRRRLQFRRRVRLASVVAFVGGSTKAAPSTSAPWAHGRSRPSSGCAPLHRCPSANYDGDYAVVASRGGRAAEPREAPPVLTVLGRDGGRELEFRCSLRWTDRRFHARPRGVPFDLRHRPLRLHADLRRWHRSRVSHDFPQSRPRQTLELRRGARQPAVRSGRHQPSRHRVAARRPTRRRPHLQSRHPARRPSTCATRRRTERSSPGQAREARTWSNKSPPPRAMGSRGAIVCNSAPASIARATTRTCCRSPAYRPKASARQLSTTLRSSSVSRTARPSSVVG